MSKNSLLAFILLALIATSLSAQDIVSFKFVPQVSGTFGKTEYEMDLHYVDSLGTLERTRSLLEFPLNTINAGFSAIIKGGQGAYDTDWKIEATILTNLKDPSGTMYDHDWYSTNNGPLTKFSYTESDANLRSLLIETSGFRRIHSGPVDIYFRMGFDYYHYDFEIIGFTGWQLIDGVPHYFTSNQKGIDYKINYYFPHAAIQFEQGHPGGNWRGTLMAGVGAIFYSDEDDHPLRFKTAISTGTGYGIIGVLSIRRYLGGSYNAKRPYIEATGNVRYYNASGNQTQTWYGDDPASDNFDDTGNSITGLPHDVRELAFRTGLKIGLSF